MNKLPYICVTIKNPHNMVQKIKTSFIKVVTEALDMGNHFIYGCLIGIGIRIVYKLLCMVF